MSLGAEIVTYVLAAVYVLAALAKFAGVKMIVENFARFGLPRWFMWLVGVAEIGGVVLLLVPSVSLVGAGGFALLMIAAAVSHLRVRDGPGTVPAFALLGLNIWVAVEAAPGFIALIGA